MRKMSNCVYSCPCGLYGDTQKPCTCAHALVTKYQKRISGSLLDRIDTAQLHRSAAGGLRKVEWGQDWRAIRMYSCPRASGRESSIGLRPDSRISNLRASSATSIIRTVVSNELPNDLCNCQTEFPMLLWGEMDAIFIRGLDHLRCVQKMASK